MIRVLLVEDHTMVRAGLQRLLEQATDIEVAGVADRGEAAIEMYIDAEPDVVLMDLSMPGIGGAEATREICSRHPDASVVMLTASTDRNSVITALDAGAIGYLAKDADPGALIEGVRAAATGGAPLDVRAARALLDDRPRTTGPDLTPREFEVLDLLADGHSNKTIATRLGIAEKTVKAHLTKVFAELEVSDRTRAALWARENRTAAPGRSGTQTS